MATKGGQTGDALFEHGFIVLPAMQIWKQDVNVDELMVSSQVQLRLAALSCGDGVPSWQSPLPAYKTHG
jgi:hypothetical protein